MSNAYGEWVPDQLSPSGFRWRDHDEPEPTSMLPIVKPSPVPRGDVGVVDPAEFDSFDDVDSRSIVDPGAPP